MIILVYAPLAAIITTLRLVVKHSADAQESNISVNLIRISLIFLETVNGRTRYLKSRFYYLTDVT